MRTIAFVVRCSGAATAAYALATALGLAESVWASMSALIVSQERLHETRSSLTGRILGTLLGAAIAIVVSHVASRVEASTAVQMTAAVAIAALVVREAPTLRVAMWTCPIILLPVQPSAPILVIALHRASEVILGAVVGWVFHWTADVVVGACTRAAPSASAVISDTETEPR